MYLRKKEQQHDFASLLIRHDENLSLSVLTNIYFVLCKNIPVMISSISGCFKMCEYVSRLSNILKGSQMFPSKTKSTHKEEKMSREEQIPPFKV